MIEVYGRATSSNVQLVMWTIGELGLDYRRHDRGHIHGGLDTPEYGAMNPHRLVPTIVDGDGPSIWEAPAIIRYLASRYGEGPFWPSDPVERSQVDMWAEWAKIGVTKSFIVPLFWAIVRTPKSKQDPAAIAAATEALTAQLRIADAELATRPYIAGDHFTVADIILGGMLYRYFDIDLEREKLPSLRAYYDALTERPAYREHIMVSYEILRVTD